MRGVLLSWNPPRFHTLSLPSLSFSLRPNRPFTFSASASVESPEQLSARERRRARSERRERKSGTNWREEVEERFIEKPKKQKGSWMDELNLDNLAKLGPQWWVFRASRVKGNEIAQLLARSLAKNYPDMDFKVYAPAVNVKRRLKNGSYSIKPKPLFPGCVFLRCVMNKELHDFIREYDGVGGFLGSKVGNTKRQINRPKPVSAEDMEAIFRQAKEEQEKTDQAFEEEEKNVALNSGIRNTELEADDVLNAIVDSKPKRGSRKTSNQVTDTDASLTRNNYKLLVPGSTVRVVSGTFSGFTGTLKKLNRKTKMATVHFTLFGKENIADIDVNEIALETK
ncbi:Transcription termination/antitermination protein NusG [Spatholobus suberectus]|nr:Transcription termination/antitermination protein NusG [Spatholobus suberectus]